MRDTAKWVVDVWSKILFKRKYSENKVLRSCGGTKAGLVITKLQLSFTFLIEISFCVHGKKRGYRSFNDLILLTVW